jgi:cytidyltransferase-like protein
MATLCALPARCRPSVAKVLRLRFKRIAKVSNNKIGLFSGTFDPVHKGHIEFALKAQNKCDLEHIYFMPEESPRRKESVTDLEHRQNMLAVATSEYEALRVLNIGQERFSVQETLPVLLSGFGGQNSTFC